MTTTKTRREFTDEFDCRAVVPCCGAAGGCYARRGRPESARAQANRTLVEDIRRVHASSRRRSSSPGVHASVQAESKRVGCNRVARLVRAHGIQAHRRRPFRKTTDSNHAFPPAPNLLDRQFASAVAPNQVWLADLTCIATGEEWLCLGAVMDLFSRKPDAERQSDASRHLLRLKRE